MDKVVVVSGGFDPIHEGHTRLFIEAEKLGDILIVILNSDEFLDKKKSGRGGKFYNNIAEREEIINWGLGVRFGRRSKVIRSIDGGMSVCETLGLVRKMYPSSDIIFANGGDRKCEEDILEYEVCRRLSIKMVFGVGGFDKPQSSSRLVEKVVEKVNIK